MKTDAFFFNEKKITVLACKDIEIYSETCMLNIFSDEFKDYSSIFKVASLFG